MRPRLAVLSVVVSCAAASLAGCGKPTPKPQQGPPPVSVAEVLTRQITDYDEFTGRFEAVERVEVRPRVSGYIQRVAFAQGREVKAGELLFEIDPRPYQAEYDRAQAELSKGRSTLALAKADLARAETLLSARAISREEYDQRVSQVRQQEAGLQGAEAAVQSAALNLEFTKVHAPISGLVSRAAVTLGNLVTGGTTLLTTVVSIDPIYVEFNADERAFLRYGELARRGERKSSRDTPNPLFVGLASEEGHPHEGVMVFVDNAINPQTGTILARGQFRNDKRLYTPGLFARVKLLGSGQYDATLIRDSAIGTDQNVKYVLVVKEDGSTEYRPVKIGPVVDGLRVVREGLKPGEKIVVNGLQRVRPGSPVTPQPVPMVESQTPVTAAAKG
ncbi:efflux RND transporter periplasmic adaptor subunit [Nevskia sp.]|uniref:efflux RND transporter periplasmic adaptor subunit n=1 Tax=Nevskia sp. TaxID=1929292 RepID=UPI0025D05EFD|nr:efflux RND transporter periplasmic adaptor subunit [Nevskia sp.]